MLYQSLFRRALALHVTSTTFRHVSFASTMAKPPQSFTLDRSVWNEDLYSHMRDFWFKGLEEGALMPNEAVLRRWYGMGASTDEMAAFDGECRENYARALEAVGPEKIALPAFENYGKEVEDASTIAGPFLAEVKEAQAQDAKHGAATLLSMILLLDQMSRNIYRDPAGLKAVFSHYDRLAFSLFYSSMRLNPNPAEHEAFRQTTAYNGWFIMPLMHSEHLPSHDLWTRKMQEWEREIQEVHGVDTSGYTNRAKQFEEKHREPLRGFGRYPHRNEALGRTSSEEEAEYLKRGETFGVQQKQGQGDDKARGKSEL